MQRIVVTTGPLDLGVLGLGIVDLHGAKEDVPRHLIPFGLIVLVHSRLYVSMRLRRNIPPTFSIMFLELVMLEGGPRHQCRASWKPTGIAGEGNRPRIYHYDSIEGFSTRAPESD